MRTIPSPAAMAEAAIVATSSTAAHSTRAKTTASRPPGDEYREMQFVIKAKNVANRTFWLAKSDGTGGNQVAFAMMAQRMRCELSPTTGMKPWGSCGPSVRR